MNTTATRYEIPAKITVETAYLVEYADIRRGDRVGDTVVADVRPGTKYTRLYDADGKAFSSVPNADVRSQDYRMTVVRTEETADSREARRRAMDNEAIEERVTAEAAKGDLPRTAAALAAMTEKVAEGYTVDSFRMGDLLAAQANDKVWARFISMVEYNFSDEAAERDDWTPAADHVEVLDRFTALLTEALVESHHFTRGLSRSTSMADNLMNDAEREATAEFIQKAKGGRLRFA